MPSFTNGLAELEAILRIDPRQIDDYAANPFGVLVYMPEDEFKLRSALDALADRLKGVRRLKIVSIAELFQEFLSDQLEQDDMTFEELYQMERRDGLEAFFPRLTTVLDRRGGLVDRIAKAADELDPASDALMLIRAGVLYGFYHVSPVLERLNSRTQVPTVLFYPGTREGETGLRFLGEHEALRGYRQRIF